MITRLLSFVAFFALVCVSASAQMAAQMTWVPAANIGGTGIAVTITIPAANQMTDLLGVPIRFIPTNSNSVAYAGTTTVNVNTIGAQPVKRASGGSLVAIAGGDFSPGVPATIMWDGTEFVQIDPATGTDPVGTERHFTGPTVPNGWLVENGQCVSETTYAALWAYYGSDIWSPGSTGGACSAGNFHLPYANGRTAVAPDNQGSQTANVLTNAGSGCAATSVAVSCGLQNRTIGQINLPNVNFTVTEPNGGQGHQHSYSVMNTSGTAFAQGTNASTAGAALTGFATTGITVNSGGSGTALATVQPTYTVLKAVKY